jgi:hypothetical protein
LRNLESNIWLFNFACTNIRGDNLQKSWNSAKYENRKLKWHNNSMMTFCSLFYGKTLLLYKFQVGIHNFTYVLDILSPFSVLEKCPKVFMTKFKPDWQDLLVIGPKGAPNFFLPLSLQDFFPEKGVDTIGRIFFESQRTKTSQENRQK